ncbi:ribulokinase [Planctomycetota bacterium]
MNRYAIGLDFGTNSVRAIVVDTQNGQELGAGVFNYVHGDMGVVIDPQDPHVARQHPADFLIGIESSVTEALREVGKGVGEKVVGIGVDSTGSTPIPVDADGEALALQSKYTDNPNAMAWLWKDHTSYKEAVEITEAAKKMHPEYLAKCGGTYSSEWYWAKLLHCARTDAVVFEAAASWVELADWVPAILTGTTSLDQLTRCICAAGHKAMFNPQWNGYPAEDFIASFDGGVLLHAYRSLPNQAFNVAQAVGTLTKAWSEKLGLNEGISVAAGAFDCHLGAVGSGIQPGTMVKVIGTSTCDLAVLPMNNDLADIPGVCGVVPESVLPGNYGVEAGQSAVGDIFNWFVHKVQPGGGLSHEALTVEAEKLKPGASGLLALDWNNGNRTILVDQQLTGLVMGLTLHSSPGEIFRALVEATAFGARMIRDRMVEYGVSIERVINCGGIAIKNPMLMQIYADVLNCPMQISASEQTCALGSAMAGAVVAGVYRDFSQAAEAMTGIREEQYTPRLDNVAVYEKLFGLYKHLHDLFGTNDYAENQHEVMKELIAIREEQRGR